MTQTFSKTRAKAEIAFGNVQSEFFSRSQGLEEHDAIVQAREEKTARLREARMAKESIDEAAANAGKLARLTKKS